MVLNRSFNTCQKTDLKLINKKKKSFNQALLKLSKKCDRFLDLARER